VLPDGRILEGGFVGGDFALLRLNVNGSQQRAMGEAPDAAAREKVMSWPSG
jgi:hypothetical protein